MSPIELENKYQEIMKDLKRWAPEGITEVNLELLQSLGLLKDVDDGFGKPKHPMTHYFHVLETQEKVTLFNDQFVIWIIPQMVDKEPVTFTIIGLIGASGIHVESVFATSGVYNTSKLVLQIVEQTLEDIQENEELLARLSAN